MMLRTTAIARLADSGAHAVSFPLDDATTLKRKTLCGA